MQTHRVQCTSTHAFGRAVWFAAVQNANPHKEHRLHHAENNVWYAFSILHTTAHIKLAETLMCACSTAAAAAAAATAILLYDLS